MRHFKINFPVALLIFRLRSYAEIYRDHDSDFVETRRLQELETTAIIKSKINSLCNTHLAIGM